MVITSMVQRYGNWIDYTVAVNLAPCLFHILRKEDPRSSSIANYKKYHELGKKNSE